MKKVVANALAVIVVGPLWPFYAMHLISDCARAWKWPHVLFAKANAIMAWGDR